VAQGDPQRIKEAYRLNQQSIYSHEEIEAICEEIESQWEYHFIARAAFPNGLISQLPQYESPQFYRDKGVHFQVCVALPLPAVMERGLEDVGHWLNQNYIIRLYGILDQDGVLKKGKEKNNSYTQILYILRQRVGAHSRGYRNPKSSEVRNLTKLIKEHFNISIEPEDAKHFNLAIDTFLQRLKEHCVRFVRSLEGESKPDRGPEPCARLCCRIFSAIRGPINALYKSIP